MKKILLLMLLVCVIVVGVVGYNGSFVASFSGGDSTYTITTNKPTLGSAHINNGDNYIYNVGKITNLHNAIGLTITCSDYGQLSNFINNYNLKAKCFYWVQDIMVTEYYSNWFDGVGSNFQVADYGNYYKIGFPTILEGF